MAKSPRNTAEFSRLVADEICERIARGESLRKICGPDRDDYLPGQTTVYRWLDENDAFAQQYARARQLYAHSVFDETRQIADLATPDTVQVARLQIDTLKWQAGKLAPKVYGDRLNVEHDVSDRLYDWLLDADGQ